MRARSIALALSLTLLASCGGGPPQSEVDTDSFISKVHNVPRIMASVRDEASVADAETQFAGFETDFDDLLSKLRGQKVPEPQKAKLRQQLEEELARMDESLKRTASDPNSPDKLTPALRERMNKAYHKLVDKIKEGKIE